MKSLKVVFVAAALLVSGSAMASVGDFRSTGEELRNGQLICPKLADSAYKKANINAQSSGEVARDVASSSHSAN
ncbi:MAG: hypothetical protein AB7K68_16935 [Bacteriovoracia bacterium]